MTSTLALKRTHSLIVSPILTRRLLPTCQVLDGNGRVSISGFSAVCDCRCSQIRRKKTACVALLVFAKNYQKYFFLFAAKQQKLLKIFVELLICCVRCLSRCVRGRENKKYQKFVYISFRAWGPSNVWLGSEASQWKSTSSSSLSAHTKRTLTTFSRWFFSSTNNSFSLAIHGQLALDSDRDWQWKIFNNSTSLWVSPTSGKTSFSEHSSSPF